MTFAITSGQMTESNDRNNLIMISASSARLPMYVYAVKIMFSRFVVFIVLFLANLVSLMTSLGVCTLI